MFSLVIILQVATRGLSFLPCWDTILKFSPRVCEEGLWPGLEGLHHFCLHPISQNWVKESQKHSLPMCPERGKLMGCLWPHSAGSASKHCLIRTRFLCAWSLLHYFLWLSLLERQMEKHATFKNSYHSFHSLLHLLSFEGVNI